MKPQTAEFELTEPEQQALAVCGIYTAEQMAAIDLGSLLHDIQLAKEHFPEVMAELREERVRELYRHLIGEPTEPGQQATPTTPDRDSGDLTIRKLPKLSPRGSRKRRRSSLTSNLKSLHDKEHCIHNTRPLKVYLSAWFTVLFYADILAWLTIPPLMLVGLIPEINAKLVIAALAIPAVPYLLSGRRACCSICQVPLFPLRRYTHNRFAHSFPLLGISLPTALHVIFCLWFRCPACGSPQRLLRRKRSGTPHP